MSYMLPSLNHLRFLCCCWNSSFLINISQDCSVKTSETWATLILEVFVLACFNSEFLYFLVCLFFFFPGLSGPFLPIPRAHFVRGRNAITSVMCRFQLSGGTNAVCTSTLSLPAPYCRVPRSLLAGGNKHNPFGGSGETGPSDCVNCPYLFISSGQNIFLVTNIFMFHISHLPPVGGKQEWKRAIAGHAVAMAFVEMQDKLKKTQ